MSEFITLSHTHVSDEKTNCPDTGYKKTENSARKYTNFKPANGLFKDIFNVVGYYAWSPIVFKENYRKSANFKFSDLVALDFDDGMTLKEAIEWVKDNDYEAMIGTTKSHQIAKRFVVADRFRLIVRANETCREAETYEYTMKLCIKEMKADDSCKDAGRFFYSCKELVLMNNEGKNRFNWVVPPFDQTAEYKNAIARQVAKIEYRDESKIPPVIWGHILWGCRPPGRHKLCYILGAHLGLRGFTVKEILALLIKNKSPLLQIGVEDVTRAITNGSNKANGLA